MVSVSGLSRSAKEAVFRAGECLGLTICQTFNDSTTHLVTDTVTSDKYRAAVGRALPVVQADWVLHSAEEGTLLAEAPYLLPPLHRLHVAVSGSGFNEEVRERIKMLVEGLGGIYERALTESCTHLVVETPTGDKFVACCSFKALGSVIVVSCGWLEECVRSGVCVGEAPFMMARQEPPMSSAVLHLIPESASEDDVQVMQRAVRVYRMWHAHVCACTRTHTHIHIRAGACTQTCKLGAIRVDRLGSNVTHIMMGKVACCDPTRWDIEVMDTRLKLVEGRHPADACGSVWWHRPMVC